MTVAQIRAAETHTMEHTPESVLMDRAAEGLTRACLDLLKRRERRTRGASVVLLVGPGNNGGDALLAGALLASRGAVVTGVGVAHTAHPRGVATLTEGGGRWHDANDDAGLGSALGALATADLVLDGIVGIGSKPGLREPAARLVAAIPETAVVVAVDIPSGLDADSGTLPHTHVRADLTVTFTALKPCLVTAPATQAAGEIVVVDVGVEPTD